MFLIVVQGVEAVVVAKPLFEGPSALAVLKRWKRKVKMNLLMSPLLRLLGNGPLTPIKETVHRNNRNVQVTLMTLSFTLKFKKMHSMVTC
jgi:hypothetical protein